jgi:cysteine desulfurase
VNVSFPGVGSEVLLHSLENKGIFISAGSACSTHKKNASPTMAAIGALREEALSAVRFSFSDANTEEEVDAAIDALHELLPVLKRYRAR